MGLPARPCVIALISGTLLATVLAGPTATAAIAAPPTTRPPTEAHAAASRARARVDALLQRYQENSRQVDAAAAALGRAFAAGTAADVDAATAQGQRRRARIAQTRQVQAIYAAGGVSQMTASVLTANSPEDALWQVTTVGRIVSGALGAADTHVRSTTSRLRLARRRALAAAAATNAQATALEDLQQRTDTARRSLAQAQQTLAALDEQARRTRVARQAAAQIAAARASARSSRITAMGPVSALGIPAEYLAAYRSAAVTCPGLTWSLLAGVGQVETGHGRDDRSSSAGAVGPMQFMPRTFEAYAVDGDHDGRLDAWDPDDAIFSAAHYLCTSAARGGGIGTPAGVHAALLAYNHAEWYVDLVLAAQRAIVRREAGSPSAGGSPPRTP